METLNSTVRSKYVYRNIYVYTSYVAYIHMYTIRSDYVLVYIFTNLS